MMRDSGVMMSELTRRQVYCIIAFDQGGVQVSGLGETISVQGAELRFKLTIHYTDGLPLFATLPCSEEITHVFK